MPDDHPARLVVRVPPGRAAERRYVLDLVLTEWLGFEYDLEIHGERVTAILRAGAPESGSLTMPDVLLATPPGDWLTERSMPAEPLAWVHADDPAGDGEAGGASGDRAAPRGRRLPVVYGKPSATGRALDRTGSGVVTSIDVFGTVFWFLTRYEELVGPEQDAHGRFPITAGLAAREGFVDRPVVDDCVRLVAAAIRLLWPDLEPATRPFRLRLTHDIDQPFAAWGRPVATVARGVAGDLVRRHDPRLAARRTRALLDARRGRIDRDPLATFDFIMDVSERHGLRSTFYFMAGTDPEGVDVRYRITDPPFAPILRRIHDRGHEIGLHGGYGTYLSQQALGDELAALRESCRAVGVDQPAWGIRQHFLRLRYPDSPRIHEALGFAHDSTVGFAERIGFRAGTGREYPLFDAEAGRAFGIRERPLVAMDTTLIEYMALAPDAAAEQVIEIVDSSRRAGSDAVILVHNDRLASDRARSWYRDLVARLAASGTP
jgi:peptidoglycan/xylan/chitin deacetylase (PgdA/CDA1 family)